LAYTAPRGAAARRGNDLASQFTTAPKTTPNQWQFVLVEVNGVNFGSQFIRVAKSRITLLPVTARTLGIAGQAGEVIGLTPGTGITLRLNEAHCHKQHTRKLLFSKVVKLTTLMSLGLRRSCSWAWCRRQSGERRPPGEGEARRGGS